MTIVSFDESGVKRQPLPAQVAAVLTRRIARGEFRDAVSPSELDVAKEFGVSRVVAREALKALETLDVVRITQGRRFLVRPAAQWDYLSPRLVEWLPSDQADGLLGDLHDVRLLLEPELAARAATGADENAIQRLRELVASMPSLEGDPEAYLGADLEFHALICNVSGNRLLERFMYSCRWLLTDSRRMTNRKPSAIPSATRVHRAIFDAIEARDPERARDAMRDHLGPEPWFAEGSARLGGRAGPLDGAGRGDHRPSD